MANLKTNTNKIVIFFSFLFASTVSKNSRSVNLALETSFLFEPHDISNNTHFLNDIRNVLDKLQTLLHPTDAVFRQKTDKIFTEFLTEIGGDMITFKDEDIKQFAQDLKTVVHKQAETDEFNNIVKDKRLKNFIKNSVTEWAETDPEKLRIEIAKYVTNKEVTVIIKFFRNLNKLFDDADIAKFKSLTAKFNTGKKNKDYTKFITKTIDFVFIKRFKKLSTILKFICRQEIKRLADYVSENYKYRIEDTKVDTEINRLWNATLKVLSDTDSSESDEVSQTDKRDLDNGNIVINKDMRLNVRKSSN